MILSLCFQLLVKYTYSYFEFLLGVPTFRNFCMSIHISFGFFTEPFTFWRSKFTELDINELIDVCQTFFLNFFC